jgi:ribose transport system ATP-binding protein
VNQLFELIRRFITPQTGVVYISHRMAELKSIADRVTVIRDGHYIDTMDMADTTMDEVISKMVGRAIDTGAKPHNIRKDRPMVLQVSHLSTKALLKDVSFDLYRGEVLGFAGLMGAGRTEVARALVGADPKSAGEIILNGKPVTIHSPARAAELGIGYLSEDRKRLGLMLQLSVAHNIAISSMSERFTTAGFMNDKAMREAVEASRKLLTIKTPSVNQLIKYLSGGNQQKAIIARWLVKDCDILIFDEPTRGIDVGAKEEIYQLLNRLAEQGKTIIMISSELPEVLRMSHRVVVMADGMIKGILSATEASQESIMRLATHGDEVITHLTEKAGR